ncbi:hypothetical protein P692DRAFT_201785598 [Suillus brevipes Sb2]|nr:hypothetical protein P692DRAFT_201785598 [Suillus brevipes Sb2]
MSIATIEENHHFQQRLGCLAAWVVTTASDGILETLGRVEKGGRQFRNYHRNTQFFGSSINCDCGIEVRRTYVV